MADYNNIFYGGTKYALDSGEDPLDYSTRISASNLGLAVDPRSANQLQEVSNKLNIGHSQVEVQGTFPNILEAIPKQHLKEINRISKLTGSKLSFHGPMVEPSGFNQQGGRWDEANRQQVERQLSNAIEAGHELDPKGNIVITLHSSAQLPELLSREKVGKEEKIRAMYVIDPYTGNVQMLKESEKFFPESVEAAPYKFEPIKEIKKINEEKWDDTLNHFVYYADVAESRGMRELESNQHLKEIQEAINSGKTNYEDVIKSEPMLQEYGEFLDPKSSSNQRREIFLRNSYNDLRNLFDMAYRSARDTNNKEDLAKLNEFREEIRKVYPKLEKNDSSAMGHAISEGVGVLKSLSEKPRIFRPFNDFAIEKSAETFANVALHSYNKFKDTAPIISIENPPAGGGISRAEDMKKLIDEARNKFIKGLSEKGISKDEAGKIAEKMIGATWDVGHINMLRKYGYEKEDLIKQAEIIAPYLKHVHLSDNFGYEHTELPMGMGNVPLKEEFEKFGKKLNEVQKVVETGDWWQHFKTPPALYTLSAFGSPVYSMKMGPYWNQASFSQGNYFAGYGTMLPDQHFQTYGGGFSGLPTELGGQVQTRGTRATGGTPMA